MKIKPDFVESLSEIKVLLEPDHSVVLMQSGAGDESNCVVLSQAERTEIADTLRRVRSKPRDLEIDLSKSSVLLQATREGYVSITRVDGASVNMVVDSVEKILDCVTLSEPDEE